MREEKKKKKKSQKRTDCEKERRRITREVGEGDDKSKKKKFTRMKCKSCGWALYFQEGSLYRRTPILVNNNILILFNLFFNYIKLLSFGPFSQVQFDI